MSTTRNLKRVAVGGIAIAALALSACGSSGGGEADNGDNKKITIGVVDGWAEGVGVTNLWKSVLEDAGYDVKIQKADVGVIYTGLSKGDIDVYLDAWLPVTHKEYVDKYKDNYVELGTWYKDGVNALTVNADSPAKSIEDLKTMGKEYGNKLVGIEAGSGLNKLTEGAIKDYGLDNLNYVTSSSPAMLSELDGAINKGNNIAVTLWHPHWAYSKYDLRDLEDPKGSMGKPEEMRIMAYKDFEDDFPALSAKFKDFKLTEDQINGMLDLMNETSDDEGVEKWIEDNKDFVDGLTPEK
ncbi:glycine betaine ABC transporter substrate-binding protein [Galactobacter sp.]|uniref:glycine betaine ABC transporter substrate-binding protein n=1 Tax=Galactobacter sp. TaxID=2676125 RepID=UPI0025C28541|nr:glycine betaine ABC transporter substrate-binding protein [Galactobacter sp.]